MKDLTIIDYDKLSDLMAAAGFKTSKHKIRWYDYLWLWLLPSGEYETNGRRMVSEIKDGFLITWSE
jgi:hypothetical protein